MGRGGNHGKGGVSALALTLGEEKRGRRRLHVGGSSGGGFKSKTKLGYLQSLALWAGTEESSMSCLAAFFGYRFADCGEGYGFPPHPSLFPCQRCETLLQPGYNCTVRIEKKKKKKTMSRKCRGKRNAPSVKNNVVYKCRFCSHRNMKRGTLKDDMQGIGPARPRVWVESVTDDLRIHQSAAVPVSCSAKEVSEKPLGEIASPAVHDSADQTATVVDADEVSDAKGTAASLVTPHTTLLKGKKRRGNQSGSKEIFDDAMMDAEKYCCSGSSKRKRKSWTSLKEIALSNEHRSKQKITSLSIPFIL